MIKNFISDLALRCDRTHQVLGIYSSDTDFAQQIIFMPIERNETENLRSDEWKTSTDA